MKIGGQPGQLPTVMIGSIFYHKHRIVKDEKTGEFDKAKAEELLQVLDKLLTITEKAGIENFLVDTTVLDIPDPGPVSKTIYLVKRDYGLPAGAGTHNAVDRLNERLKLSTTEYLVASCVANTFPIIMGANFILYGPIEDSQNAYFYSMLADAYVAYSLRQEYRLKPLTKEHPLFKAFK